MLAAQGQMKEGVRPPLLHPLSLRSRLEWFLRGKLEIIPQKEVSEIWLIVRPIVTNELDISLPSDLLTLNRSSDRASPFPIDDHRRPATVEFLIGDHGGDGKFDFLGDTADLPSARVGRP